MILLMPFGLDIDWALAPEKINVGIVNTAHRGKCGLLKKFSLNKINSLLHFIHFFKTLRYFVASAFVARI